MARVRNVLDLVEKAEECINLLYDMTPRNIDCLITASAGKYDLAINSFRFGYMQGVKAARAERRAK